MKPKLLDSFDPVTLADIRQFEQELSIDLPSDYCEFLLDTNGGVFRHDAYNENLDSVETLYGLVPTKLRGYFADLRRDPFFCTDRTLLRIGDNSLGDQLLLQVGKSEFGSVRMHHMDLNPDDDESTTRPVASNFDELLKSLEQDAECDASKESDPLFRAIEEENDAEFRKLFRGADVHKKSDDGWPILGFAAAGCQLEIMRELLRAGADMEALGPNNETPLFRAIRSQMVDPVKLLVQHGANVNAVDEKGDSALMVAIRISNGRAALHLIESGTDIDYRAPSGKTARDCSRDPLVQSWFNTQFD